MKFRHLPGVFALFALFAAFDSHAALMPQYYLNAPVNPVPLAEPASGLLIACGFGLLALARHRRVV